MKRRIAPSTNPRATIAANMGKSAVVQEIQINSKLSGRENLGRHDG
jgi:hypothetical protein